MSDSRRLYGVLAEFETASALVHACEEVRDRGFQRWDAHTPFPIHGLDRAMGMRPSPLGYLVFLTAMLGAAAGFGLQAWVHSVAYPLVISGKPYFSWPTYIPITFEVGVLGGALGAVIGMLVINRLMTFHHPLFQSERFERATDDRFFISIEAADSRFDGEATPKLLRELGASHVEAIGDEDDASGEAGA